MNNTNTTTKTFKNEGEQHLSSPPVFSEIRVARFLVFCVLLRRSMFVLLFFFFWPLCFLSFDLHFLMTPLVSSTSSFKNGVYVYYLYCVRIVSRTVKKNWRMGWTRYNYSFYWSLLLRQCRECIIDHRCIFIFSTNVVLMFIYGECHYFVSLVRSLYPDLR